MRRNRSSVGINVGEHRRFRPSVLAGELSAYDVVNVGATGILIVRNPGARRAKFLAELRQKLPFEAELAFCNGSDLSVGNGKPVWT